MAEQKPPETKVIEDPHGKLYSTICPHCGRHIVSRQPGAALCTCGNKVELKS